MVTTIAGSHRHQTPSKDEQDETKTRLGGAKWERMNKNVSIELFLRPGTTGEGENDDDGDLIPEAQTR